MKTITFLSLIGLALNAKYAAACWSERLGYPCCSGGSTVYYTDNDGAWGVENNNWCGIVSQASCWSTGLGYPCCSNSGTTVYYTDNDGAWGVENGDWCGIVSGNNNTTTRKTTTTTTTRKTTTTTTKAPEPTSSYPKGSGIQVYTQCKNPKHWAMTYDDGPTQHAGKILDLLKSKGIKATFFIVGQMYGNINSAESQAMIKRMYSEGHVIANHSWSHPYLTNMSEQQITNEVKQVEDIIYKVIGKRPAFLRPPYGSVDQNVLNALKKNGYTAAINWNVDPMDYSNGGDKNYAVRVLGEKVGQGVISLNHLQFNGSNDSNIVALATAEIDFMMSKGYKSVTMEECLGISAYQ